MKLIKNNIELNGSGAVTLCPEEPEDMVSDIPPFPSNHSKTLVAYRYNIRLSILVACI